MVIVIIAGHIDLSVGSIVGFVGGVVAITMQHWGWPWWLAILSGLVLGSIVGMWQGFWVAYVGVPAFIVTLAGWLAFRGLAILLVGVTVSIGTQPQFVAISNGSIANFLGYIADRDVVTLVLGRPGHRAAGVHPAPGPPRDAQPRPRRRAGHRALGPARGAQRPGRVLRLDPGRQPWRDADRPAHRRRRDRRLLVRHAAHRVRSQRVRDGRQPPGCDPVGRRHQEDELLHLRQHRLCWPRSPQS